MSNEIKLDEANNLEDDAMLPEYDFSQGVRGKHYQTYREGHTVKIHKTDGSTVVQHFTIAEGAVVLEPDVKAYFPDLVSVNKALRGLIALIPEKKQVKTQ
jgi:hypothetical protein